MPKSCELVIGGAVHSLDHMHGNWYPWVYGLNYLGRECGYGEHSIAISVASPAEWMKSVLFTNYKKPHGTVQFVDADHQEGDPCSRNDGRAAQCVPVSRCSRRWSQFLSNGTIDLCASSSLVCCPLNDITNTETDVIHPQLSECPNLVRNLKPTSSNGSVVRYSTLYFKQRFQLRFHRYLLHGLQRMVWNSDVLVQS